MAVSRPPELIWHETAFRPTVKPTESFACATFWTWLPGKLINPFFNQSKPQRKVLKLKRKITISPICLAICLKCLTFIQYHNFPIKFVILPGFCHFIAFSEIVSTSEFPAYRHLTNWDKNWCAGRENWRVNRCKHHFKFQDSVWW